MVTHGSLLALSGCINLSIKAEGPNYGGSSAEEVKKGLDSPTPP